MTKEGVGMGEGLGAERIAQSAKRRFSLRLLLVECEALPGQNVKPVGDVELLRIDLQDKEIQPFIQEAATWAQTGLKSRKALEGDKSGS